MKTRTRTFGITLASLVLALTAASCGTGDDAGGAVEVVATTSILGDITRNVVGDAATVTVLVPSGTDPHDYQASSQQVADLVAADLVVANGLGLEEGLADVLDAAARDGARVIEVAAAVDPLPLAGGDDLDPHFWLDPLRVAGAARVIAAELDAVAPGTDWGMRAAAYAAELDSAGESIAEVLAAVPVARRRLVTNHDALGYFAARYGYEVIGTIIPGGATLAEPSSAQLADLVATIVREQVPAVFAETTEPSVLAAAIAAEAGDDVEVVELYTGSLGGPGSGADTLIGMLETNAARIAAALS